MPGIRWMVCMVALMGSLALADSGVVFLDEMDSVHQWTHNETVSLRIDPVQRKVGPSSLRVDFAVRRDLPGASMFARRDVGLSSSPAQWHFYVLVELDERYRPGVPKFRMIVQDSDGTAVLADIDRLVTRPGNITPWAEVRLMAEQFVPLWPGENGTLDGVAVIAFDIPHRAGEMREDGQYTLWIDELAAVFDDVEESIHRQVETLSARRDELIDALATFPDGTWKAYPRSSLAVVEQIIPHAQADLRQGRPVRAARQLRYLRTICDTLETKFSKVREGSVSWNDVPVVDRRNLQVRQGNFHDGSLPVYPGGLCGNWGPAQFEAYAALGFTGLSAEVGPSTTCPEPDKRSLPQSRIELLNLAAEHNLAFDLLLSPHYMPAWAYEAYPDLDRESLRRKRNPFMRWNVDSAGLRAVISAHLEQVIPAVRDCPALASYDLSNELWYAMLGDFDPADFREFLRKTYPSIDALNRAWAADFPHFDAVQYRADGPAAAADLFKYNQYRVTRFYRWYLAEVHRHDNTRPIYVKVHGGHRQTLAADRAALSRFLTAAGADCYPSMGSQDGLLLDAWETALQTQQYRSTAPDRPVIDSEEHLIYYGQIPTADYVRSVRWWRAVLGLDAYYLWAWGRRNEYDEGTLMSQPWALEALLHTGYDLQAQAETISAFQTHRPDVLLVDSGPELMAAYKLMSFAGRPFDVLHPSALTDDLLARYRTIVLPPESDYLPPANLPAKVIHLETDHLHDPAALAQRTDSTMNPILTPRWGVVNYTVPGPTGQPIVFLLNLTPHALTLNGSHQSTAQCTAEPLQPILFRQ